MKNKTEARKRVEIVSLKVVREETFLYEERRITSAKSASKIVTPFLENLDKEKFVIACLNTKNEIDQLHTVSIGSLNASIVHPRDVFKLAILSNANSIICFHNHPSGNTDPSKEDINITERLVKVGELVGINVLDHIIIGNDGKYMSFKEEDLI